MRPHFLRVHAPSLLLCLLLAAPGSAADVWDGAPFDSDPQKLLAAANAVTPQKPEDGVVVLLAESVVEFAADGRSTRVDRLLFRIVEESAVDGWGTIQTSWQPWYHEQPSVEARVISADGSVHRLDPKSFGAGDAEDEPDMFSDTRILSGPLPAVAPGAVIEQTITYRDKNPLGDTGLTSRHEFRPWVETRQSRLVLKHPAAVALRVVNKTMPRVEPRRTEAGGVTTLVFETGVQLPVEHVEWSVPPDVDATSMVAWTTGSSWQTVARRYREIVDEKIGDHSAVVKATAKAIAGAKDRRTKIDRILAAIARDIRYAGVEFGEGSIFPRTPLETLRNKYGDCKDKATLLVAMLREAGIPAHAVLIHSGFGADVEPDLPGLGLFNHVIVRVDDPEPLWIDPTDEFARAGELPDSDQGRRVLIARDDTTELTITPIADAIANRTVETREFWLSEDGKARVRETSEYYGSGERANRRYYHSADAKTAADALESYVQGAYLAKKLASWDKSDPRDLSRPFRLSVDVNDAPRGTTAGGEAAVGIFWARLTGDLPAELQQTDETRKELELEPRKAEYLFSRPYVLDLQYIIHPPIGYAPRDLPEPETLKLGTATMTRAYRVREDGAVIADYRMDSGPRRITAAQFEEMRAAVVKLNEEPAFLFYFDQTGSRLLAEGDVGKAVAEFRNVAAQHPKEGLHRADVARALLAGGFGAAARKEALQATKLEPTSARAHATLGSILTNDLIGRPLRKGCDIAGAIAAYRKARELAPQDLLIRSEYAFTLSHSDDGVRYADPARVGLAIDEYLAIRKDIEDVDLAAVDRELMPLYAFAARWDDLQALVDATTDTQLKDRFVLVLAAVRNGGAAAVKAASQIPLASRRDAMAGAGGALMLLRMYPAAADLLTAAAQGAPNAAQIRAQADMIRKTVRHEEITIKDDDPESLLKSLFLDMFLNTSSDEQLSKKFATADVAEVLTTSDDNPSARSRARSARGKSAAAMRKVTESKAITDLALASISVQKDGDEQVGLRLRSRSAGTGQSEFTAYVVRENGRYRFAAVGDTPSGFGLRALRLVEKNEIAAAKQWLDWAREHVNAGGEDPVGASPFSAIWTRGREATADEIRLAAAMLLPDTRKSAALALPLLNAAAATASADTQWRIDQARLAAHQALEEWDASLRVAEGLSSRFPDSGVAFQAATLSLLKLDREDELRKRAQERLARLPGDRTALEVLGNHALRRGDYAEALGYFDQLLDRANAKPVDFNQHAWCSIFLGKDMAKALENAQYAAGRDPSYAILNTLAVVFAEQGNSSEARDTLLKSMEARGDNEIESPDWYVVGRIAQNYGILDVAREAYARVEKPEEPGGSSWALAQQRLAELK